MSGHIIGAAQLLVWSAGIVDKYHFAYKRVVVPVQSVQ